MNNSTLNLKNLWGILLLAEIVVLIFFIAFFSETWQIILFQVVYTLLYFTTALALEKNRKIMLWSAMLLFMASLSARIWLLPDLEALSKLLNLLFFCLIVISFINQIARAKTVTRRVILEAINGYFLLGLIFSFSIGLMEHVDPAAFNFSASSSASNYDTFYYTFVTFATLGYGDLVPVKPYAKSLAILIAAGGQLYVAVIIALLVGKFASQSRPNEP